MIQDFIIIKENTKNMGNTNKKHAQNTATLLDYAEVTKIVACGGFIRKYDLCRFLLR